MSSKDEILYGRDTLRYVRLALLVVPLLLMVAIVIYGLLNGKVEDSISSYYLGPSRDLFVAMLVSTGVLLVVYKGAPLEDYALNLAGFYAIFVALVPTRLGQTLSSLTSSAQIQLIRSVQISIVAVLVVSAVFVWLEWKTKKWTPRALHTSKLSTILSLSSTVALVAFIGLLFWRSIEGTDFAGVHYAAALLLILSMGVAIASHLGREDLCEVDTSGGRPIHYAVLLILMALGIIGWFVLNALGIAQALFIVEWYEIGLFSYFWYLESRRLWEAPTPREKLGD
ncbi:hypothetical protein [Glutamicibacter ardleyensis]|uniref:Uncharacterized protein n=1 Tax=Glutamicibacter ardleyensis TaxID=225894 RepID=A0ABQ2DFL5_9MICC|nr:hypothetical protein [Glutamicibacter ardleyensis]GGJ56246.1 hypothetical protein GCM10007173_13840 [Glutamicibacter ardleyensis]